MQEKSRIAVTGANGFVARSLRRYLYSRGVGVVAIARRGFKKFESETAVISKNYSEDDILPHVVQCHTMIHLVGMGRQTAADNYDAVNTGLTGEMVRVCQKSDIHKIIYNSGLGVSKNTRVGYFISKYRAERQIVDSGLDYTIFRPSYIIGRGDLLSKNLRRQIKQGTLLIPGSGKYKIRPISINDACMAFLQAVKSKKFSRKTIDLVGPRAITFGGFLRQVARGKPVGIRKIDLEKAYFEAIHDSCPVYGIDDLNILVGGFVGNFEKIKKLSGHTFATMDGILKAGGLS